MTSEMTSEHRYRAVVADAAVGDVACDLRSCGGRPKIPLGVAGAWLEDGEDPGMGTYTMSR